MYYNVIKVLISQQAAVLVSFDILYTLLTTFLLSNLFFLHNQIVVFFENLNFYFMKTAKILV